MGLLNVYSYSKTINPHIAYRFKVTFFYNKGAEEITSLTYYVKSVELPVWNMNTETRQRFGNTQYVIPTFDFGQSTLKIVFLENDGMNVSYFLNGFLFNYRENLDGNMNLWNNCASEILKIKIDELDPSMRGTIVSNIYACHLKRLSTPHFTSLSYGAPVEVEAEFVVRYKINSIETEIGALPREIKEPETLQDDILAGRVQEELNKNLIEQKSKAAALTVRQRLLTEAEIEKIKKMRLGQMDKAKGVAAARRYTKLENARKDADKDGRIVDKSTGNVYFVTAEEKTKYIKKKQAEAEQQMKNIKAAQAYVYDNFGIDLTKVKSVEEIQGMAELQNLSYEDQKQLGKIVRALVEETDKLQATKQELWKSKQSTVVELNSDAAHANYMGSWDPNDKTFADKYNEARREVEAIEQREALIQKANDISQSNMSEREKAAYLEELEKQISKIDASLAKNNGINTGVTAGGEARAANATGTNAQGSNTYRGSKGSVEFNAQTTSYDDGTTMTVLDVTNTSMRGSSYKAFHQDNSGEGQANRDVTIVLHRQAGSGKSYTQNVGQAAHDSISTGAAIYIDDNGNIVANMDRIRQLGSTAAQGKDTRDAIAIEISGAVDIRKGSDGKYYARTVTGKKSGGSDVIFKEISETEAKQYGLYEYDESNSNADLMSSVNKAKQGTKKAVDANGNIVNVTFTNVYAQGYSQAQLDALQKVGELLRSQGINATGAVSHGMIDRASAKTEGNYITNQQGMKALGFG